MAASEARIAANRANALKSTGPRTPEGKARSRRNGLKHGLAGEGIVLRPEDEAKLAERRIAWAECLGPRDELDAYLVDRAALRSVQLDRVSGCDSARGVDAVRRADAAYEADLTGQIEAAEAEARAWGRLADVLARSGHLDGEPFDRARALLGLGGPEDPRAADFVALNREAADESRAALPAELRAAFPGLAPPPEAADPEAVARREDARAALRRLVERRRDLALARAARLRDDLESPEARALALALVAIDGSPEAHLLRRYETACELGLFRALNHLRKRAADPESDRPAPDHEPAPDGLPRAEGACRLAAPQSPETPCCPSFVQTSCSSGLCGGEPSSPPVPDEPNAPAPPRSDRPLPHQSPRVEAVAATGPADEATPLAPSRPGGGAGPAPEHPARPHPRAQHLCSPDLCDAARPAASPAPGSPALLDNPGRQGRAASLRDEPNAARPAHDAGGAGRPASDPPAHLGSPARAVEPGVA